MPESGLTDFFGRHSKLGKLLFTISPCNCKLSFFANLSQIKFDFQISQFYFDAFFNESEFRKLEIRNDSRNQRILLLEKSYRKENKRKVCNCSTLKITRNIWFTF